MGRFIIRRLLSLIPILLFVSMLIFVLVRLMPGGAATAYLRASNIVPTAEAIANAKKQLGLDEPVLLQYLKWMKGVLRLDLGTSYYNNRIVTEEIASALRYTGWLTGISLLWLVSMTIPLGVLSARRPGGIMDHFSRIFSFLGASTPEFLLGFLLVMLFSLHLGWLPVFGAKTASSVILPSFTLAVSFVASHSRVLRNSLLENVDRRYVTSERSRGLSEARILLCHVLRNSLIPVMTTLGLTFGHMLAGSVIVENVFAWPGMGRLLIDSVNNRDYPMLQGYVLAMAVIFVLSNLVTDVVCAMLNPRIRYEEKP